jgi:hypothetical protein
MGNENPGNMEEVVGSLKELEDLNAETGDYLLGVEKRINKVDEAYKERIVEINELLLALKEERDPNQPEGEN